MKRPGVDQTSYYRGVPTAPYDLIKEITVVLAVMLVVVLGLSVLLSSPDEPPVTIQSWARTAPTDFLQTAAAELQGATISSDYGPPYNVDADGADHDRGAGIGAAVQTLGPLAPQVWAGVHQPVNPARADVIQPLELAGVGRPALTAALLQYQHASPVQQDRWVSAYDAALEHARVHGPLVLVGPGRYGPLNVMLQALLADGRAGALDAVLARSRGRFYQTDYTKPLLFLGDGSYLAGLAARQNLAGNQWGMTNETGRYPGQAWLWLYTLWYQIPPFSTASNADLMVVLVMGLLSTLLVLVPFIPGLRDLPRWLRLHRLVWREHYRFASKARPGSR